MPDTPARLFRAGLNRPLSRRKMLGLMSATATVAVMRRSWTGDARSDALADTPPPPSYHGIVGLL